MNAIIILVGIVTMYTADTWGGNPLYCARPGNQMYYEQGRDPWVAVPVELYSQGWQCGDVVQIDFESGERINARAFDAGPLSDFYIWSFPDLPIVADVPQYFWPYDDWRISAHASITNVSLLARNYNSFLEGTK